MEGFFHTLKTELVMHCDYKTRDDAGQLVRLHRSVLQPAATALID